MTTRKRLRPLTQSHYVVTSPGLPDAYFTEFSGVKEKRETTDVPDGQSRRVYKIVGMTSIEEVTLKVPYDPEVHDGIITAYERLRDTGETTNIVVTPVTDANDPTPRGKSFTLNGCQVTGIEVAEVNRGSTDVSMLTLMFVPDGFTRD